LRHLRIEVWNWFSENNCLLLNHQLDVVSLREQPNMKTAICLCASLVLFLSPIASAADKHNKGGGGKAAAHAAPGTGGGGGANGKGTRMGAGRAFDRSAHMGGGAQRNGAGSGLHSAGQAGHAQHGLNGHQGAQHGLNARAGNGLGGHQAGRLSGNHLNRGFTRQGRFGGDHWRSGQRWRNYHALYSGYHRAWHDRGWWRGHYNRVVFVDGNYWGGNWYWDGGYWFPAWGYDPVYAGYTYDGPIFAYANLPPDQVVVNIQEALQDQGYYAGEIDGQLGQQTRDALSAYQRDHSLELTAAIDEATVQALGLTTAEEV
jgi:hypothetical protein